MTALAVLALAVLCVLAFATRATWFQMGAETLVCSNNLVPSDAILIDNVEHGYLLFERAQRLEARGLAGTVLIPILSSERNGEPGAVSLGFAEVMCRISRLHSCTTFHAPSREPISLNLARAAAEEFQVRRVRSVIVVTGGFRSRRSCAVYTRVLQPLGISVHCEPVFASRRTPENWTDSWHGIQQVALESLKLWYYRLIVLPRLYAYPPQTDQTDPLSEINSSKPLRGVASPLETPGRAEHAAVSG